MYIWIAAYVAVAAAFYTFAVRTAKPDPLTERPEALPIEEHREPVVESVPELVSAGRNR